MADTIRAADSFYTDEHPLKTLREARMNKIKKFVKTSIIGGILVLLPVVILIAAFNWVFRLITNWIQPITNLVIRNNGMPELIGDVLVVVLISLICFFVGSLLSTSLGKWLHKHFDSYLIQLAPGYKLIKEIVGQFFGDSSTSPFSNGEVAKVNIFGGNSKTSVTALVTSRHPDGSFTVFVPTGPNPTSGNMYHVLAEQVELFPELAVEDMMRTIIACGAGSAVLFKQEDAQVKQEDTQTK
ncbi:MAG: hypothetical protein COA42_01875 [Alteromonadaceae bacterium]|nr:MAG: hypothetical protein COA42_01875 [Alteromonadaceae bacterium]